LTPNPQKDWTVLKGENKIKRTACFIERIGIDEFKKNVLGMIT